jgi:hypothetical protein
MDIMKDPVSGNDGEVFERSAIVEWLKRNNTSPVTRNPLYPRDLRTCLPIKSLIEEYHAKQAIQQVTQKAKAYQTQSAKCLPAIKPRITLNAFHNMLDISIDYSNEHLKATNASTPTDLVANIDLSISMNDPSSRKNIEGGQWSILSLVKHSLIANIKGLNENCRFAIVTFSSISRLRYPPCFMTEDNKKRAIAAVNLLGVEGNTNLFSGIKQCYEIIKEYNLTNNPTIMTFTDGISNNDPPSGLLPSIERFILNEKESAVLSNVNMPIMNVFGFGSDLRTNDLYKIANLTGGRFDYISDFSMVGTVFVNSLTNTLLTANSNECLCINQKSTLYGTYKNKIKKIYGYDVEPQETFEVNTKSTMYGQTRNIVIEFDNIVTTGNIPNITYVADPTLEMYAAFYSLEDESANVTDVLSNIVLAKLHNILFRDVISHDYNARKQRIKSFCTEVIMDGTIPSRCPEVWNNILTDVENELYLGLTEENFSTWGHKYICAYTKALEFQQCNNFKDKVMSHFGSGYHDVLRNQIEEIYMDIEPPKTRQNVQVNRQTFTKISYNCGGGCISGDTRLIVKQGKQIKNIPAQDIAPGDMVLTSDKGNVSFSSIVFVVVQQLSGVIIELNDDIKITPWHPMYDSQQHKYVFPENIKNGKKIDYNALNVKSNDVYNFVVENRKDIMLGHKLNSSKQSLELPTIKAMVSLGHGIVDDEVAKHPYLGTEKVIQDLHGLRNEQGTNRVLVCKEDRDPETNLICKYY